MRHIGNDIVDLNDPPNRRKSLDQRFISRVFNPAEKRQIEYADNPDTTLWALWASKEAAYKAVSKSNPQVSSIPRSYDVQLFDHDMGDGLMGTVLTPVEPVFVKIFVCDDYLHCVGMSGSSEDLGFVDWGIGCHDAPPDDESASVRQTARRGIAKAMDCPFDAIHIVNHCPTGIPRVAIHGLPANMAISLSHDGRFTAYAFHISALEDHLPL